MKFVAQCVEQSLPIWQACLQTPFLQAVADGTLDEACFQGYLVDDSLYLREYARVFAWGMLGARTMEQMRAYYSLLSFVNEAEDSTRRIYLRRYGLDEARVDELPLRPENQAYVDTMLQAAKNAEGPAECMMACLPCMLSYAWLFPRLQTPQAMQSPYGRWIADYIDERYLKLCDSWVDFAEQACTDLTPARQELCREIFRACSEHELRFWQMSGTPRQDL